MAAAAVPRLIHDPGIGDEDLWEHMLMSIGRHLGKARSITEGRLSLIHI